MLRLGGPAIDPSILDPLLSWRSRSRCSSSTLHLAAMRNEILRRRVRTLRLMQARAAAGDDDAWTWAACGLHRRRLCGRRCSSSLPLIAWVVLDYRAQRRTLADLEARGITRRSAPSRESRHERTPCRRPKPRAPARRLVVLLPLAVFLALAALFFVPPRRRRSLAASLGADRPSGA